MIAPGTRVRLTHARDAVGVVVSGPDEFAGTAFVEVDFAGDTSTYAVHELEKVELATGDLEGLLRAGSWGSKETLARVVTYTRLDSPLRDVLYSLRSARTRYEPYQYKPLVKFLESPKQRLLIADEVGLGKTIEAGYVLRELKARLGGGFKRALIVCPASLRLKWQKEMHDRFEERFELLDTAGVRAKIDEYARRGDLCRFQAICSTQTLRGRRRGTGGGDVRQADYAADPRGRPSLLDAFEDGFPPLDLVVVDEAHHLRNPSSLTHRLGLVLGELADALVLMTATPVQRKEQDLFSLLHVLDPLEFDHFDSFARRTRANERVVAADAELRQRRPGAIDRCRGELLALRGDPALWPQVNPKLHAMVLDKLDALDPGDRAAVADVQHDLTQLNLFAHAITRTRKSQVSVDRPVREPRVVGPAWTSDEREFYEAVSDFCVRGLRVARQRRRRPLRGVPVATADGLVHSRRAGPLRRRRRRARGRRGRGRGPGRGDARRRGRAGRAVPAA